MDRLDRVWTLELTNALPWHTTSVHSTRKPVLGGSCKVCLSVFSVQDFFCSLKREDFPLYNPDWVTPRMRSALGRVGLEGGEYGTYRYQARRGVVGNL